MMMSSAGPITVARSEDPAQLDAGCPRFRADKAERISTASHPRKSGTRHSHSPSPRSNLASVVLPAVRLDRSPETTMFESMTTAPLAAVPSTIPSLASRS